MTANVTFNCIEMGNSVRWMATIGNIAAYWDIPKTTPQPLLPFSVDCDSRFMGRRHNSPSLWEALLGIRPAYTQEYLEWQQQPCTEWPEIMTKLLNALESKV